MVNPLNLCERLIQDWITEKELELLIDFDYLENFVTRNGLSMVKMIDKNGNKSYRVVRQKVPVCFISGNEQKEFSFLDLSDLHIGHPEFNEKILRAKLKRAVKIGVQCVFIAGDVFEGIQKMVPYEEALSIQFKQLDIATKIFKDYPLNYYVINGNHDYSFEAFGLHNPIHLLQNNLTREGINFKFFDTYMMDFIVCGVGKRVMHIEKYIKNKYVPCVIERINRFEDNELYAHYKGRTYPIRFFACGHIHINMELYYERKKVYISQPGSFVQGNEKCQRGNFVSGEVQDGKIFRN